jgi:hypothetical protein
MPVISNTKCAETFGTSIVTSTTLCCTGTEFKGTCTVTTLNLQILFPIKNKFGIFRAIQEAL